MPIEKLLDPKNDFAFKKIFGSKQHETILVHFLNDMLELKSGQQIEKVTFLKPIQEPEIASKNQSIVDVLCQDEEGIQYIVEMQVANYKGFEKRAQFYAAKAYAGQMNVAEEYHTLKEIIFLAIANFVMFPAKSGYYSTHIILDAQELTRDLKDFSFSFLELPKFAKSFDELHNKIDRWAYFFKHASSVTPEELELLTANNSIFKEAYSALERSHWSESELNSYEACLKRDRDERVIRASCRDEGLHEGIKIGKEQGEKREALRIAKNLLDSGMDVERVLLLVGIEKSDLETFIT